MSIAPSLRSRLKRLEQHMLTARTPGFAETLRVAKERLDAMSPHERAAERCRCVHRDLQVLAEPALLEGNSDARLQRLRRRAATRHLAAISSLVEPDLPIVSELALEPYWALCDQRRRREEARAYLADVALAGALIDPSIVTPIPRANSGSAEASSAKHRAASAAAQVVAERPPSIPTGAADDAA